jgi:hypothetical protein
MGKKKRRFNIRLTIKIRTRRPPLAGAELIRNTTVPIDADGGISNHFE